MSEPIHSIRQGADRPKMGAVLRDSDGNPVPLTSAPNVDLEVYPIGSDTVTEAGTKLPATGAVEFGMENVAALEVGTHRAAILVTWGTGDKEYFPSDGWVWIRVLRAPVP